VLPFDWGKITRYPTELTSTELSELTHQVSLYLVSILVSCETDKDFFLILLLQFNYNSIMNTLLKHATGTGKTKLALELALEKISTFKIDRVLILIAQKVHKQTWLDEITKWGFDFSKANLQFVCYASLHKLKGNSYSLIIADEAHHLSTTRLSSLSSIHFNDLLLLTATMTDRKLKEIEKITGKIQVSEYSLSEAISNNRLVKPKIILHPFTLNNTVPTEIMYKGKPYEKRVTELYYYTTLCKRIESAKQRNEEQKMFFLSTERKRFLSRIKNKFIPSIFTRVINKKTIWFTNDIASSKFLPFATPLNSKIKDPKQVMLNYNNNKFKHLVVCQMANESVNLTGIECGVFCQLDASTCMQIQKIGRVLRSDHPEIHVMYLKDTQDEKWLQQLQNLF